LQYLKKKSLLLPYGYKKQHSLLLFAYSDFLCSMLSFSKRLPLFTWYILPSFSFPLSCFFHLYLPLYTQFFFHIVHFITFSRIFPLSMH
jgi:hypothetical protein